MRWVAEVLGHSNPAFTLRTYAHALPVDEADLAFADFGTTSDAPGRPYTAPAPGKPSPNEDAPGASGRGRVENLEHETGFEPATLTLAT